MLAYDSIDYPNYHGPKLAMSNSRVHNFISKADSVEKDDLCSCSAQQGCGACEQSKQSCCSRDEKENALQHLYHMEGSYDDDDDDDDDDWEPMEKPVTKKWFCINCTMPNFEDATECDVCGENKNSEILVYGHFASPVGAKAQTSLKLDTLIRRQETVERSTAIGFDERMLLHSEVEMKTHPHPERPDRLRAIVASLSTADIYPHKCLLIPAREISENELCQVHSSDHVEAVKCTSYLLSSYFTPDTYANGHSACAARLAAGICSDLANAIVTGKVRNGFALVRPPGHHAGVKHAMGFCLHNNAAVAAKAGESAGAGKILIVDWDVHHGNGTQEIFEGSKTVLYVSLHRHEDGRFYPGTGAAKEVGVKDGEGYSVNIPWLTGGVGDNDYIFAFQNVVLPIASEFAPDLTIISAGFDAARGDPLGCCEVTPYGYALMTHMLSNVSKGKLLVILEGGYNLRSISSSATAVVKVLLGEIPVEQEKDIVPSKCGLQAVLEVLRIHSGYWTSLKSCYAEVQSKWGMFQPKRKEIIKKTRRQFGPVWWKWGSKSLAYRFIYRVRKKIRRRRPLCSLNVGHGA